MIWPFIANSVSVNFFWIRKSLRVIVDGRRTLQPIEIALLIKLHRKRDIGWLIALDEPLYKKPNKNTG